jgi:protein involved in polysaccharide export with SLBB domain
LSQDPYLRPGDIIEINRADRKVSIGGAVERPGTYELLKGENLKTLVSYYANGLTVQADTTRIELSRRVGTEIKTGQKIYLDKNVMDEDFELVYYDYVTIPSYESLKPVIFVEGAVNVSAGDSGTQQDASNRIPYRFEVGTNYAQFVRSNIGLFSAVSDTENAYIIRKGELIPINVSKMLYDANYYSDFELEENDILRIPFKQLFVVVSGAVNQPGKYPYIPDRTYDYYVNLAGGFVKEKNRGDAVKIIDINGEKVTKSEYITPESIIDAKSNSFLYFFNQYAPILTTLLSVVGTTLSVIAVTQAK